MRLFAAKIHFFELTIPFIVVIAAFTLYHGVGDTMHMKDFFQCFTYSGGFMLIVDNHMRRKRIIRSAHRFDKHVMVIAHLYIVGNHMIDHDDGDDVRDS